MTEREGEWGNVIFEQQLGLLQVNATAPFIS